MSKIGNNKKTSYVCDSMGDLLKKKESRLKPTKSKGAWKLNWQEEVQEYLGHMLDQSFGSRKSWNQDLESVGSTRSLERTAGWANSVAQQPGPSWPLSPNDVINPHKNVTQGRGDKRFSTYPKTLSMFQTGAGLFSTQLQDLSSLKKPEIPKSIRVTQPQTFFPRTTFQQQRSSVFPNRQRRQRTKHNSCNKAMERQSQTTVSQATPKEIYQPIGDPRGLPKHKLTEFSGQPLEWPEWAEFFNVIVHQKWLIDTGKMQYLKISFTGQVKLQLVDWVSTQRHIIKPGTFSAKKVWQTECHCSFSTHEDIHTSSN